MPELGFTLHRITRNVKTPQVAYEVRDARGHVREDGAVNQGRVIEVGDGETLTLRVLPLPEREDEPAVAVPREWNAD